jgi:hypothetical protein
MLLIKNDKEDIRVQDLFKACEARFLDYRRYKSHLVGKEQKFNRYVEIGNE